MVWGACGVRQGKDIQQPPKPVLQHWKCLQVFRSPICFLQGGAPVKDLKDLANAGITIGIDTFLALNPNELQVRSWCAVALFPAEGKGQSRAGLWGSRLQSQQITKALFFTFLFFLKLFLAPHPVRKALCGSVSCGADQRCCMHIAETQCHGCQKPAWDRRSRTEESRKSDRRALLDQETVPGGTGPNPGNRPARGDGGAQPHGDHHPASPHHLGQYRPHDHRPPHHRPPRFPQPHCHEQPPS